MDKAMAEIVTLSIIIVNWNTRDLLATCLDAIRRSLSSEGADTTLQAEVIVVDNGSTDGTVEMLRRDYPDVRLIENRENVGFARANNQGLAASRGRYLLLLNTDAFLRGPALARLVRFMDEHPEAGIVGPRLYFGDGTLQRSCYAFPTLATEFYGAIGLDRLFPRSRLFGRYRLGYWDMRDVREVDVVMGACLMARREVFEQIGGLDERFFMYSEEVDWCYRARQAGWRIYYVPQAEATHLWGGTARVLPVQTVVQLYHSRLLFFRKHYGPATTAAYKAVLALACLVRLAALPVGVLATLLVMVRGRASAQTRLRQILVKGAGYRSLLWALPSL
jgi:GT2 family glycosyltransferase